MPPLPGSPAPKPLLLTALASAGRGSSAGALQGAGRGQLREERKRPGDSSGGFVNPKGPGVTLWPGRALPRGVRGSEGCPGAGEGTSAQRHGTAGPGPSPSLPLAVPGPEHFPLAGWEIKPGDLETSRKHSRIWLLGPEGTGRGGHGVVILPCPPSPATHVHVTPLGEKSRPLAAGPELWGGGGDTLIARRG